MTYEIWIGFSIYDKKLEIEWNLFLSHKMGKNDRKEVKKIIKYIIYAWKLKAEYIHRLERHT